MECIFFLIMEYMYFFTYVCEHACASVRVIVYKRATGRNRKEHEDVEIIIYIIILLEF